MMELSEKSEEQKKKGRERSGETERKKKFVNEHDEEKYTE